MRNASQFMLRKKMTRKDIAIVIELNSGHHSDIVYTCDLSYDYVRINAEYTTWKKSTGLYRNCEIYHDKVMRIY